MSSDIAPAKRPAEATVQNEVVDSNSKKPKLDIPSGGVTEKDVGITLFLSPDVTGFKGQIKQRYTDFLVNEIDKDGNVLHLTDKGFKMPETKEKPEANGEQQGEPQQQQQQEQEKLELTEEQRTQLTDIFGESDVAKILEVYRTGTPMETERSFDNKSQRTKIHQLLREIFNNKLESVTTATNTFKLAKNNRKSRVNKKVLIEQSRDENGVENWGYGPSKQFIHFTLEKENKDTMDAVNIICKLLKVPTKLMRFAGTKDRRAVTCQRLSISRIGIDRLNALNKTLKGMRIGGYKFSDESLNLGDLSGNEFTIVIRDVGISGEGDQKLEDVLEKSLDALKANGFINYFGLQRFGTFSISTHTIGKELLAGNWKIAAELILSDQENVLPKSKEARQLWARTHDPRLALQKMPRQCIAESAILNTLVSQKREEDGSFSSNAYYVAIMKIPRNLRTMYVHAYQSFVWNVAASKRIELFGLKPVEGDLVINKDEASGEALEDNGDSDFDEDLREARFVRARAITEEEAKSGKFTLEDVVLPTPGFDVVYPSNKELRQIYVEIMEKDGMNPFDMRRKVRDFSLAGSYRNVIQKPKNMEYRIVHYNDATQQLVNTDSEILNNKLAKENGRMYLKSKLGRYIPDTTGDKVGVIVKFQLETSAYATMALRELTKLETSRRGDMCEVKS